MKPFHTTAGITECYECGEKCMCEVIVADVPDPETGYVDEYAICEACKYGPVPVAGATPKEG